VPALRLHNGSLEAVVLPETGGGLAAFNWIGAGGPLPLMRSLPSGVTAAEPNQLACYPLVPWSNRIGHGRFTFEGNAFALAPNHPREPHPIHGDGWLSAWSVLDRDADAVTLGLDKSASSPFTYVAGMSYALQADTLAVELWAENRGAVRMPFGLGLHPWFDRTPGVRLQAPAEGMWIAGPDVLPLAHGVPPPDASFQQFAPLPQRLVDNCFSGWSGVAQIRWEDRGVGLRIESAPPLPYYVLYCPALKAVFCFEPVTHPIDAFNLPEPFAGAGLAVLTPGQRLSIRVTFRALVPQGSQS
jgi:aldose 1-epimerase